MIIDNRIVGLVIITLSFVGGCTITVLLAMLIDDLKIKFHKWKINDCKIKCLCHHEFEERMQLKRFDHIEYVFVCRKCKKRKVITIWESKDGVE